MVLSRGSTAHVRFIEVVMVLVADEPSGKRITIPPRQSPIVLGVVFIPIAILTYACVDSLLAPNSEVTIARAITTVSILVIITTIFIALVWQHLAWTLCASETILVGNEDVIFELTVLDRHRRRTFVRSQMKGLRIAEHEYRGRGITRIIRHIAFDYNGVIVTTSRSLSKAEADVVIGVLRNEAEQVLSN